VRFERYEIHDMVASEILKREVGKPGAEVRVYSLPTNAEEGRPEIEVLYWLIPFPKWRLCVRRERHAHSILFVGSECPVCHSEPRDHDPIRFVRACPQGHLDDVDWHYLIHRGESCNSDYFEWIGGMSLSQVRIRCPTCGSEANLGELWFRGLPCSGRLPERNEPPEQCSSRSFILLRQASNLRVPYVITLFPVAPLYTRLHQLLQNHTIWGLITGISDLPDFWERFGKGLQQLCNEGRLDSQTVREILDAGERWVRKAVEDLRHVPRTFEDALRREFETFVEGSREGIPPRYDSRLKPLLEVRREEVRQVGRFTVAPVCRLRTILVQVGYWRDVDRQSGRPPRLVHVDTRQGETLWFPGVELLGEGVFITLSEGESLMVKGNGSDEWMCVWEQEKKQKKYPSFVFRYSDQRELHPLFVWWHSLSHLLIRAISRFAGYPLASIRERVYCERAGPELRGGILLYTVQPGAEGTMGGLLSLVNRFDQLLRATEEMGGMCSQDPICWENAFRAGKYAGASCFSCLQLPETCCEHRNMWLDRRVFVEGLEGLNVPS
jgi:hypothetical protein